MKVPHNMHDFIPMFTSDIEMGSMSERVKSKQHTRNMTAPTPANKNFAI